MKIDLKFRLKEKVYRSFLKAFTWRIIGTLSLMAVTYFFTRQLHLSAALGAIDVFSNIILYVIHERVWEAVSWGRSFWDNLSFADTYQRSIAKTISWRILASSYLILVAYLLTGKVFVSVSISLTDFVLNLIEYYIHERGWNKIKLGK